MWEKVSSNHQVKQVSLSFAPLQLSACPTYTNMHTNTHRDIYTRRNMNIQQHWAFNHDTNDDHNDDACYSLTHKIESLKKKYV